MNYNGKSKGGIVFVALILEFTFANISRAGLGNDDSWYKGSLGPAPATPSSSGASSGGGNSGSSGSAASTYSSSPSSSGYGTIDPYSPVGLVLMPIGMILSPSSYFKPRRRAPVYYPPSAPVQQQPAPGQFQNEQGVIQLNNRNYTAAIAYFEQAVQLAPNNATYRENLRIAKAQRQNGQALELNDRAVGLYKRGYFSKAVSLLEQACADDPQNDTIRTNLSNARKSIRVQSAEIEWRNRELERRKQEEEASQSSAKNMQAGIKSVITSLNQGTPDHASGGSPDKLPGGGLPFMSGDNATPGAGTQGSQNPGGSLQFGNPGAGSLANGNSQSSGGGITGLPGIYLGNPATGEGMKSGSGGAAPQTPASSASNKDRGVPAVQPTSASSATASSISTGSSPNQTAASDQGAAGEQGNPQASSAPKPAFTSLRQQADAFQEASSASSMEDASSKARGGFDNSPGAGVSVVSPTQPPSAEAPVAASANVAAPQVPAMNAYQAASSASLLEDASSKARGNFDASARSGVSVGSPVQPPATFVAQLAPVSAPANLAGSQASSMNALRLRLDKIQVPPPIPPEVAEVGLYKPQSDPRSDAVLMLSDTGLAVVDVVGKVGGKEFPPFGLLIIAGKTLIAAEDAADVYIVKNNGVYDQALAFLKDNSTRTEFAKLVTAVRNHRPISENVSVKMLAAAQAVADPTLNDPRHDWKVALWAIQSPNARRAALTRLALEGAGMAAGTAMSKMLSSGVNAVQTPAYEEANMILEKAHRALANPTLSSDAKIFLQGLIDRSNKVIASSYRTEIPKALMKKADKALFEKMTDEAPQQ